MSKAVLLSIRPRWCELIASGQKTVEVRRNRPKVQTPFNVYIYCTKDGFFGVQSKTNPAKKTNASGKVIGEFVCDEIALLDIDSEGVGLWADDGFYYLDECGWKPALTREEVIDYCGTKRPYGWHISALQIYDNPREISEFYRLCDFYGRDVGRCWECGSAVGKEHDCGINGRCHLTHAPQSWCYVEKNT